MKRSALVAVVALSVAACGGAKKGARGAVAPVANPQAVAKMVSAVKFAKDPGGRPRAIGLLREAVTLDASLWEAHYDLGVLLAEDGDLAGAEPELEKAAKLAPDAEDVASALAEVRRRRGEHTRAADGLREFVEQHPNAVFARTIYVAALRDAGRIDAAIAQAREVLVRKPSDASALAELALSHLAKGERETAELLVKEALSANENNAVAHRTAGLVALAKGDDAAAFASFAAASKLDPKDTTARLDMATVLLRAGAYEKAAAEFRAVLEVAKEDTDATIGLAAALRGQADKDHPAPLAEAQKLLEGVLARDPHDVAAELNLALLYADHLKKPEAAKPLFERFLADAPSDHPSRAAAEQELKALAVAPAAVPVPAAAAGAGGK